VSPEAVWRTTTTAIQQCRLSARSLVSHAADGLPEFEHRDIPGDGEER
jgi:hypothetical protein